MASSLIALRIQSPSDAEETVAATLWDLGTAGFEVRPTSADPQAQEILAYFPQSADVAEVIRAVTSACPAAQIAETRVPDVDWVARFREEFVPFEVGPFLIAPEWSIPAPAGRTLLVVDPGRAFGTGTHESTRLCLLLLDRLARQGPLGRVADIGAGSAILALAAAKLGAAAVVASDLDPEAIECARAHLRLNPTSPRVQLVVGDGAAPFAPGSADLVLANLTAPLLTAHAAPLASLATRHLILSGLLTEDAPTVVAAFRAFDPAPHIETLGEWAGLVLTRGAP